MSEETTIIDKLNTNERPKDLKPRRGRLILKNLSANDKQLIKSGGFTLGGLLAGSGLYVMFGSGYDNAQDVIKKDHSSDTTSEIDDLQPSKEELAIIYTEACFANTVTNEMPFKDAFANARAQTGPGGFFEWRGNVYNTYYENEWDEMSQNQKGEYWSSVTASAEYDTLALVQKDDIEGQDCIEEKVDGHQPASIDHKTETQNASEQSSEEEGGIVKEEVVNPVFGIAHNKDGVPEAIAIDEDDDGYVDAVVLDEDGDGWFEVQYSDIDNDEDLDIIVVDHDEDGHQDDGVVENTSTTIPIDQFIIVDEDNPIVADNKNLLIEDDLLDEEDDNIEEGLI